MELISDFLSYMQIDLKYSINTCLSYKRVLLEFYRYFDNNIKLNLLESEFDDYLTYLTNKQISPKTINLHITVIKNFYKFLVLEKIIETSIVFSFTSLKTKKSLPNYLSKEDILKFLDIDITTFVGLRNKCLFELMYGSGLRVSEVINLTPNDLDLYELKVLVKGKGNKEREVPISKYSKYFIDMYLDKYFDNKNHYLFYTTRGKIIKREVLYNIVHDRAKEIGLSTSVSPHTLRHTFATHLLSGGADIRVIQVMLGHSDIRTTEVYTHVENKELKNAYDKFHPLS